ncbi:MAG: metal-dependent hydrolase [archaeon]
MFIGHATLAFGVAALLAAHLGPQRRVSIGGSRWTVEYALLVGIVAAMFASLPDVDVLHALVDVVSLPNGTGVADHFWNATTERHRAMTHSLVVGGVASIGFALWVEHRWLGGVVLAGLAALITTFDGMIGGVIIALFVTIGVVITSWADAGELPTSTIFGASLLGLTLHPFTDLLTGEPPAFLAPWSVTIVSERIEPFADATLNLLVAFGAELAVIWFGLLIGSSLLGIDPRNHVHYAAILGVVYAPMAFVLEQPSVDAATPFVASILFVGVVGIVGWDRARRHERAVTVLLTALAAITVAWVAFGMLYVAMA